VCAVDMSAINVQAIEASAYFIFIFLLIFHCRIEAIQTFKAEVEQNKTKTF
jgi:hypothetical protein